MCARRNEWPPGPPYIPRRFGNWKELHDERTFFFTWIKMYFYFMDLRHARCEFIVSLITLISYIAQKRLIHLRRLLQKKFKQYVR